MVAAAGRYFRLLGHLGRYTLNRELAFRGNFLVKVSVEVLWLGILVAFYKTVFARTTHVAHWSESEYFFFVGCYFAINGLTEFLFLENFNEFAELVRTGDLDFLLLRPIDEQFLISLRKIDWGTAPNVLMGGILMVLALVQKGWQFDPVARGGLCGHLRLCHGHRLWLHAASNLALGLDGPQPEPDGDVVVVLQPGTLSQGDLRRQAGRASGQLLHLHHSHPGRLQRPRQRHGPRVRSVDGLLCIVAAALLLYTSRLFFHRALRSYRSASS